MIDGKEIRRGSSRPDWERLIIGINSEELWIRRRVARWDLNDWLLPIDDLIRAKRYAEALDVLQDITKTCVSLKQYDNREPQAYWAEKLATVHQRLRNKPAAAAVLTDWLTHWPDTRFRTNHDVERVTRRLAAIQP
ncbi:tetratricopeptide repeat protein [Paeniglutamicibacter sp. R2-26]|uniref:tetratricopeptide repeat protein n=1 Tax=Paeniglutamicibacter sp. R2-26 TaxID=3144417 RepID=UPI003EE809D6